MRITAGLLLLIAGVCSAATGLRNTVDVKKYQLYFKPMNWHGAFLHCAANGMALASIESKDEQKTVATLIKQSGKKGSFWLGASDLHDGDYAWYSNGKPLTYSHFGAGEPNHYSQGCSDTSDHCLELIVGKKYNKYPSHDWDYEWNDTFCNLTQYFVCEYY